jgi:hypothetical protein
MMKRKIEIEVDDGVVPAGFTAVCYGRCEDHGGELCLGSGGTVLPTESVLGNRLILARVEPKRESRWRRVPSIQNPLSFHSYTTKEEASYAWVGRVERIDYENDNPVHVTLEPTP